MSSLASSNPNVFYHKHRGRYALIGIVGLICMINSAYELLITPFSLLWWTRLTTTILLLLVAVDFSQLAFWTRLSIMPTGIQYRHLLFTTLIEWSNIKLEPTYMRSDGSCEYKLSFSAPILNPNSRLGRLIGKEGQKDLLRLDRFVSDWHESPLLSYIKQHTDAANARVE